MMNYSFHVQWSAEDNEYVAVSAEFPGLSGLGHTADQALAELRDAISVAVDALVEDGEPVPEPILLTSHSGQLRLRLPKSVHAAAVVRAEQEGVSLNALLQNYVVAGLSADLAVSTAMSAVRSFLEFGTPGGGSGYPHPQRAAPLPAAALPTRSYSVRSPHRGSSNASSKSFAYAASGSDQHARVRRESRVPELCLHELQ